MSQESKRNHIKTLVEGKKHTPKEIISIVGVSIATVYNVISKIKSQTTLIHKVGASRPALLIPKVQKFVAKVISQTPSISIHGLVTKCQVNVGRYTMHRCLKTLKYSKPYPKAVPLYQKRIACINLNGPKIT